MIKITIFLLAFLSITVMSYGMPIQSFAADTAPLTVDVEFNSYREGAEINITGVIRDYDQTNDATLRITDPTGAFVYFGQITPKSDGTFSGNNYKDRSTGNNSENAILGQSYKFYNFLTLCN